MYRDSIAEGRHFYGRVVVVDVAYLDLTRVMRNVPILARLNKQCHPDKVRRGILPRLMHLPYCSST